MKVSKVSRHYDIMHKDEFEELHGEARKQRLDKLMKGLKRQQDSLFMPTIDKEKAMLSSYIVSQKIVEKCQPFQMANLSKNVWWHVQSKMSVCPAKQSLGELLMAGDSREQLKILSKKFEYFYLALDGTRISRYITAFDLCSRRKC